jgi:glyoxylase-like metal-dependent hydrolase (beta-lactamase superfamily II)
MRTLAVRSSSLAAGLSALLAAGLMAAAPEYTFVDVAPGVRAALMPTALRFTDANVVLVAVGEATLVVDGPGDPALARQVVEEARRLDRPVRWVVNTHWHGDHTRANGLYLASFPGVEILGHESLLADVPERDGPALAEERERWRAAIAAAEQRLRDGVDEKGVALAAAGRAELEARLGRGRERLRAMEAMAPTPPTLALDGGVSLHRAGTTVRLLPFRGHTRGDLVVFLPEARVLLSGDLLDELPYFGHGQPREWKAALDVLDELDFDQVVPGHGGVLAGKDQLRTVRELLRVVTEAAAAAPATETAEGLAARLDLAAFRDSLVVDGASERAWKEAVPDLAARALAEARSEP